MTPTQFEDLADRIDGLWEPRMNSAARGAYFDVLRDLAIGDVRQAVAQIARTSRDRRPRAGLIYETAEALRESRQPREDRAVPEVDPLPPEANGAVLAELRRVQSPEHARRAAAVKASGKRFSMGQLRELLIEKACASEEFDRRLAAWSKKAPTTSRPEPAPEPRRTLLPSGDDW